MPFVATILARTLALQDWFLGQYVDVSTVASASPNNCWSFDIVNATVNACGQALAGNTTAGGWASILGIVNMTPTLLSVLVWAGPFAGWQPYVRYNPPPTPTP